jgi:hypothetical protein
MTPFLSILDLSRQPRDRQELVWDIIAPALLNYLDERGVEATVGYDLNTVAEFHHRYPDMPLFPPFDPLAQPEAGRGNTLVLQLTRKIDGVPVGLIGSRRIHVYPDLNKMMRSLDFFYADRSRIPEGEYCIPTKRVGEHIRDNHVSLGGVFYVDEEQRRNGCGKALARLSRLLTLTLPLWKWSWLCVLMTAENMLRIGRNVAGFQSWQSGIIRMRSDEDDMQKRNYWLGSARREDVEADFFVPSIADLSVRLDQPTPQEIELAKREAGQ